MEVDKKYLVGIDCSHYQKMLGFAELKAWDFVIHKMTQGAGYVDPKWKGRDLKEFKRIYCTDLFGCYHYVTKDSVAGQVANIINNFEFMRGNCLLALDFEDITVQKHFEIVIQIIERLRNYEPDWHPIVYTNKHLFEDMVPDYYKPECSWWLADYRENCDIKCGMYTLVMKQFSTLEGKLDLDVFYGSEKGWRAFAKSTKNFKW